MGDDKNQNIIKQFSEFVDQYPLLLEEIRSSNEPIQTYFEKWSLLGDEDPFWNKYKQNHKEQKNTSNKSKKNDWIEEIMQYSKHVNMDQVQKHVHSISEAVQSLQSIYSKFKDKPDDIKNKVRHKDLFHIFKD